jgi:hypothetical protein
MKAFRDIKTEMCENSASLIEARIGRTEVPARIARGSAGDDEGDSNIAQWMAASFHALTHASETGEPFALVSCFMNGQPAAIIALTRNDGRSTHIMPLFLAVDSSMNFSRHPDQASEDDETP